MDKKLIKQWQLFVKSNYRSSRFTKDLYEVMHIQPGFIAHFDRNGFHKARFWTTRDLDQTLGLMSKNKTLKALYNSVETGTYIHARLAVARIEYSVSITQANVMRDFAENLKKQYRNF